MTAVLFTPLDIGPVQAPNRIAIAPMCQYSANDGCASDWHLQLVMNYGMSGAGTVILEATGVTPAGAVRLFAPSKRYARTTTPGLRATSSAGL